MFEILCFGEPAELKAVKAFTNWQMIFCNYRDTGEALEYTKGCPLPVLIKDGIKVAVGYFNIVNWFVSNGFILC